MATNNDPIVLFTIDEPQLGAAVKSLKMAIKGQRVTDIKCTLSKKQLKIDCGSWGCAVVSAKSERTTSFKITNQALSRVAACHAKLKKGSTEAPARIHKTNKYLETPNTWITFK